MIFNKNKNSIQQGLNNKIHFLVDLCISKLIEEESVVSFGCDDLKCILSRLELLNNLIDTQLKAYKAYQELNKYRKEY